MCNSGASKSKSAEVLRLFTVTSLGASASTATRTWDNQRRLWLTKCAPTRHGWKPAGRNLPRGWLGRDTAANMNAAFSW
jgi:hypothetical protein